MFRMLTRAALAAALFTPFAALAEVEVTVVDKAPPAEVADALKAPLQEKAVTLSDGGEPLFEFWFVKEVALKGAPASPAEALDQVKEVAFLGVVQVHGEHWDFRDDPITEGVYTLRFGLQPVDGNHLGTAEFPYFAILVPAAHDTKLDGFPGHDELVDESSAATDAEHPRILSLRPAEKPDATEPELHEPAEEKMSVGIQIPVAGGGSLPFELVYEGHGEL